MLIDLTRLLTSPDRAMASRGPAGRGHGRQSYLEAPREFTGNTTQVCGLWPFSVGTTAPTIGVPLGPHLSGESTICCDPLNWFRPGRIINNPSCFIIAIPGVGKSTIIRKQQMGLAASGVVPLILGDLKGEYVDMTRAIVVRDAQGNERAGQVITLGIGRASLNLLGAGAMDHAAQTVADHARTKSGEERKELLAHADRMREEAHARRLTSVTAQLGLTRQQPLQDYETTMLSAALRELIVAWKRRQSEPVMSDLFALIEAGPDSVRKVSGWRGEESRYLAITERLQATIRAWMESPLGQVFGKRTTEPVRLDAPAVCIDISHISRSDVSLQAAALLACWSEGFGQVNAANELADLGLAPQRIYSAVLDELWRPLAAGAPGIVDRINELSRVNRTDGCAVTYATHSLADLRAMRDDADRAKALGLVERAGMVICGGLPRRELVELAQIVPFTESEQREITGWATPPDWDPRAVPPGQGKFMVKVGERPGVPFQVQLTEVERRLDLHNTSKRWDVPAVVPA